MTRFRTAKDRIKEALDAIDGLTFYERWKAGQAHKLPAYTITIVDAQITRTFEDGTPRTAVVSFTIMLHVNTPPDSTAEDDNAELLEQMEQILMGMPTVAHLIDDVVVMVSNPPVITDSILPISDIEPTNALGALIGTMEFEHTQ